MDNHHTHSFTLDVVLTLGSILLSTFGHFVQDADLVLGVMAKLASLITFICFLVINHQTIRDKFKEFIVLSVNKLKKKK